MFGSKKSKTCKLEGELKRCREENAKASRDLVSEIDRLMSQPVPALVLPLPQRRVVK